MVGLSVLFVVLSRSPQVPAEGARELEEQRAGAAGAAAASGRGHHGGHPLRRVGLTAALKHWMEETLQLTRASPAPTLSNG